MARFLNRDVDVIARNGSGATLTRRELARRPDPLGGKRIVIWEFAVRDLTQANWEVVPLPESAGPAAPGGTPGETAPLLVQATVVATSHVPQPYTVPYKDCLTYVKLRVDQVSAGRYSDGQMIAVFYGMKDNVLLPAAHYAAGQRLRLKVVPLAQAPAELRSARTADDLDDYTHRPFFVLEEEGL